MLKKTLIASLICLGGLFNSSAAPTLGGPTLSANTSGTNSSSGGGLDTNAVIALIEQYGGGGGVVSNVTGLTLSLETRYTNDTAYYAYVSASAALTTTASASDTAAIAIKIDTDANGTYEYTAHQAAQQGRAATALSYTSELGAIISPGAVFIYDGTVAAGGGVDIPLGSGQIVYFSTNGTSGGGGGVSAAEVGPIAVAAMATNNAAGATNLIDNMLVRNSYYVSAAYGSDTNNGSSGLPWQSIGYANSNAVNGSTVYVGPGVYLQGIWKSGVIWDLADGAIISLSGSDLCVTATNEANVLVIGKGALKNNDSNPSILKDETSSAEISCKFIQGGFSLSGKYTNDTKFLVESDFISQGGIVTMFDYADAGLCEISVNNARLDNWDDAAAEFPFTMSGCVSRAALAANALRIGTVLVNTNISATLNTP